MDENDFPERKSFLEEVETLLNKNDYQTVLDLAQSRLNRMPGDLDARSIICRVWIQQGRLDEAGNMIREIEDLLSSFSRIYACMGDICLKKGMRDSAQSFFRKFMAMNPDASLSPEISEGLQESEDIPEENAETEEEESAPVPSDFQTVTLAELYIRQGHLPMAAEVLEAVLRKDPHHEKAAAMLREVWAMTLRESSVKKYAPVVAELSRWLDNIGRLRSHAE
jgi:tetratricopeptide (TPR) repeat protein